MLLEISISLVLLQSSELPVVSAPEGSPFQGRAVEEVVRERYNELVGGPEDVSVLQIRDQRTSYAVPEGIQEIVGSYLGGLESSASERGIDVSGPSLESWKFGDCSGLATESSRDLRAFLVQNGREVRDYTLYGSTNSLYRWDVWDRDARALAKVPSRPNMPVQISSWTKTAERWPGHHFRADSLVIGALDWMARMRAAGVEIRESFGPKAAKFSLSVEIDLLSEPSQDLRGLLLHMMAPIACRRVEMEVEANSENDSFSITVKQIDEEGRPLMVYGWSGIGEFSLMHSTHTYLLYLPGTTNILVEQRKTYTSGSSVDQLLGHEFQAPSLKGLSANDKRGKPSKPKTYILGNRIPIQL